MVTGMDVLEQHAEVVVENIDEVRREQWLKLRRLGIGGSDAAAALGKSPWTSQYALWAEKTGEFGDPTELEGDEIFWGNELEASIVTGFSKKWGIPTVRFRKMLRSRRWPWMVVNLDALAPDDPAVVEVKNVGLRMAEEWAEGAAPDHYRLQVIHQLAVTGLPRGYLAALVGGQSIRVVEIERDEKMIENLAEAERRFWTLVENNTPPAVDGSESTKDALAQRYADPTPLSEVQLDESVLDLIAVRAQLLVQGKALDEKIAAYDNTLRSLLGEHEIGKVGSRVVVTWKKQTRKAHTVKGSEFRKLDVKKI